MFNTHALFRQLLILSLLIFFGSVRSIDAFGTGNVPDNRRMQAVTTFADLVLEYGRDRYGEQHSPLFVDGLDIRTLQPAPDLYGEHSNEITGYKGSNLADQQILFRTLAGLTNLTGRSSYKKAAMDAISWHFDRQYPGGLLDWGHHRYIDLKGLNTVGDKGKHHELKENFPFYELMYEVDPTATKRLIMGMWNAHIRDWEALTFDRHARMDLDPPSQNLWDQHFKDPNPYFEFGGHTLLSGGGDLIDAAARLYLLTGQREALDWALKLAGMYVKARNPKTGLGAYVFTVNPGYHMDQFKADFGEEIRMGDVLFRFTFLERGYPDQIYADFARNQLVLAESLGDSGRLLLEWAHEGMVSYLRHAYHAEDNLFHPLWADGRDLNGYRLKTDGYFGSKGDTLLPFEPGPDFLLSYATLYRLTEDAVVWQALRAMFKGNGLGDIGERHGISARLNFSTSDSHAKTLLALLELYRSTQNEQFLLLAEKIGDNIVDQKFHNGFFVRSKDHYICNFSTLEPLAILTLESVLADRIGSVPVYNGGGEFFWSRIVRVSTWKSDDPVGNGVSNE